MTDNIFVFDRNIIRQKRNRAASHLDKHGFLFDWTSNQMLDRLEFIKKYFELGLQIGNRAKFSAPSIKKLITFDLAENLNPNIIGDEELLPFKADSFDVVISSLNLHATNDLPGTLSQIRNILKPDGLFMAGMFGGETLYELRAIMNQIEMEEYGGISPRISPFADLPQMGSLMQRAGLNLPVIDLEKVIVSYDNIFKLMQDLRLMGESNSTKARVKHFTSRHFFQKVAEQYQEQYSEKDGQIRATFEIIFLLGWKPHDSQQKPLRPGSAENRLADALSVNEGKLPC